MRGPTINVEHAKRREQAVRDALGQLDQPSHRKSVALHGQLLQRARGKEIGETRDDGLPVQLARTLPFLTLHAGALLVPDALENERGDSALPVLHNIGKRADQVISKLVRQT